MQAQIHHFVFGQIGFDHRHDLFDHIQQCNRRLPDRLFDNRGDNFSLPLCAHKIAVEIANTAVPKRLCAREMLHPARKFLRECKAVIARHMVFAVDIFRFFIGDFHIHPAEFVDNRGEHIKTDEHIVVNIHFEIVFERVHKQLRAAVALCGIELVLAVVGDFQIHIPQK